VKARSAPVTAMVLAGAILLSLTGCGDAQAPGKASSATPPEPRSTPEPFTHQQQLVVQGARLFVSDGCSACHLGTSKHGVGPSFESFAGHHVTLADGRSVLVNEHFVRETLLDPRANPIEGFDPASMIAAVDRLQLSRHPERVTALAAFIEQIGPEPE
jgi:hypothetical protein